MNIALQIGNNFVCKTTPGKRYAFRVNNLAIGACTLRPFEADSVSESPRKYFTTAPEEIEPLAWSPAGNNINMGFQFVATMSGLYLESTVAGGIEALIVPVE